MAGKRYRESPQITEEISLEDREEIRRFVRQLGYEPPEEDLSTSGKSPDINANAVYRLENISEESFELALIHNDEVTAEVDLEVNLPDETQTYEGTVTDNAYTIFDPPGSNSPTDTRSYDT